jgi:hypothetical protein
MAAAQSSPAVFYPCGFGVLYRFFIILNGDKSLQVALFVHDRQFSIVLRRSPEPASGWVLRRGNVVFLVITA